MGSPISIAMAEIVMQNSEEQTLATYSQTLPLCRCYVDDTITAVHKNKIYEFHEHLNKQNSSIQFTKENGKIPFLDCLVTRENNTLRTTVYRKRTHTVRLLTKRLTVILHTTWSDYGTNLDEKTRAQIVCDTHNNITRHVNTVFIKNNYSRDFIKCNTYVEPNDSQQLRHH